MGLDVGAPLRGIDIKACTTSKGAFIEITCPPSALGITRPYLDKIQIDMPLSGEQIACRIHVDLIGLSEFDLLEEIAPIYGAPVRNRHWVHKTSINQIIELSLEHTANGLHLDYVTEQMPNCGQIVSIF